MDSERQARTVLGLDLGRIATRATLFGVEDGKYRLVGQGMTPASSGAGRHLGESVGVALEDLQRATGRDLVRKDGGLIQPALASGAGLDQLALVASVGEPVRTVILGLTEAGSLAAARALGDSLPLTLAGCFGLADLADYSAQIDRLVALRPEFVILVGGVSPDAEGLTRQWIEVLRVACQLLPEPARPRLLYAGHPAAREELQRRLEPLTQVDICPNLMPISGRYDLAPAQRRVDRVVTGRWEQTLEGFKELRWLAEGRVLSAGFALQRMARFLSRAPLGVADQANTSGVMAVDLGGGSTTLVAGQNGEAQSVTCPAWRPLSDWQATQTVESVYRWTAEPVSATQVGRYLAQHALHPELVPVTPREWAIEQAWGRQRLQTACARLARNFPGTPDRPTAVCQRPFEPIIASGAILTQAPNLGQALLMLLDGLQPRGVTTLVLDRYQILPVLGQAAETLPILPVHLLESEAFQNLATVIVPISPAPSGAKILTIEIAKESGSDFSVEILQGALRRLVIQVGERAVLTLKPERETDVGFGGPGVGGRLKVTGGALGLVIDARGRPLVLPGDDQARVGLLQRWSWILSG